MTSSLYRKYRPALFAEVVGQDHVIKTLQNEVVHRKLAHAYLFCGMRGIGKTTVARILAKSINCEERTESQSEPCNKCQSCLAITSGRSLDLLEIDAASNRRIDDIREIKEHIPYGPSQAKYKVVIVDEVHMLTTEAFNALLKTLEEPPAHTLFILCTTEVHKLPETIVSRCQRFDFKRLSSSVLLERLRQLSSQEKVKIEESVLRQVVELAGGSSRDAEGYLGKLVSLGEKIIGSKEAALVLPQADIAQALDFLAYLIANEAGRAVELINDFITQGGDITYFYRQVLGLLRKMMLIKLGGKLADEVSIDLVPEYQARLNELSHQLTFSRLQFIMEQWLAAETNLRSTDLWQLPLELAAVSIAGINQEKPLDKIKPPKEDSPVVSDKSVVDSSKYKAPDKIVFSQINERWSEVVASLREYNHSLSYILSVARPLKLEGQTLVVGFSYRLHMERVQDPKIVTVIERAFESVLGDKLRLRAEVSDQSAEGANLLSSVIDTFGGQVVD